MKVTKAQLMEMVREKVKNRLNELFLVEQAGLEQLPDELRQKSIDVADKYMKGDARWFSLENLFWDLEAFVLDPMEVVTYIYNELIKAALEDSEPGVTERQKQRAQNAYYKLINLARQARLDL